MYTLEIIGFLAWTIAVYKLGCRAGRRGGSDDAHAEIETLKEYRELSLTWERSLMFSEKFGVRFGVKQSK